MKKALAFLSAVAVMMGSLVLPIPAAAQVNNISQCVDLPAGFIRDGSTACSRLLKVNPDGSLQVESLSSWTHINSLSTTTVKTGPGELHTLAINTAGSSNPITIYDSTTGSGNVIAVIDGAVCCRSTYLFDVAFTNGLTIVEAGTTAADITVTYH